MNEPVQRPHVGYDLNGQPVYGAWPVQPSQVTRSVNLADLRQQPPLQPIKAHPWGAYLVGGCLGLAALIVVAFVIVAILVGFSIALSVLAITVVSLVICLLILRDVWRSTRKEN
ncbi:hypothetical protein [Streptomyces cavernae]|uniref:hypothetical protein n=1 Tax=Streptomyces cavernae TaxID=2259034 RepID=UPI000FEC02DA|nr:hypothetical protein [Streptomyces cavernae]